MNRIVMNPNELDLTNRDAFGVHGVVAAADPIASKVGVTILQKGGNAVDAAVATAFALGVVEPNASGVGGGGFMLIKMADDPEGVFIDFRETVAQALTKDSFLAEDGSAKPEMSAGIQSVVVPGDVAGLLLALEQYGTMPLAEVIAPAIALAEQGFAIGNTFAKIVEHYHEKLLANKALAKTYLKDGQPLEVGDLLINKDYGHTLRLIAEQGSDVFYRGEIADKIVAEMERLGGKITMADLANYQVKVRKPVQGHYRGYEIISAPPASSGGTHVIEILNIIENVDFTKIGSLSSERLHFLAEAMNRAFLDREQYMADTDFAEVPIKGLLSKDYAKALFTAIDPDLKAESKGNVEPMAYESGSTTHFSVMDGAGSMVAVTKTINYFFGSGIMVPGTGMILNNEMTNFSHLPTSRNCIEPNKRPLSSMSPTVILKDGQPWATLGSPGAKRIITTVAMIISNMIDYGMTVQEAIDFPRIHQLEEGPLFVEGRVSDEAIKGLIAKGHEVEIKDAFDLFFGGAQGIVRLADGRLHGGADPRRGGKAIAY